MSPLGAECHNEQQSWYIRDCGQTARKGGVSTKDEEAFGVSLCFSLNLLSLCVPGIICINKYAAVAVPTLCRLSTNSAGCPHWVRACQVCLERVATTNVAACGVV